MMRPGVEEAELRLSEEEAMALYEANARMHRRSATSPPSALSHMQGAELKGNQDRKWSPSWVTFSLLKS